MRQAGRHIAHAAVRVGPLREALRRRTLAGALPDDVWRRLPVDRSFEVDTDRASFTYEPVPGDLLARPLYWRGLDGWEPETLREWSARASRARLVLDIGANTGLYSLIAAAANSTSRIQAFEPVPAVAVRLRANVRANGWGERVQVHQVAVGDVDGPVEFILTDRELPLSAHLASAAYRDHSGSRAVIEGRRVDDLVAEHAAVDLVKIDVEGAEDAVLRGMPKVLSEGRPDLVIECWDEGPHRAVQALLGPLGYRIWHLGPAGAVPVTDIVPDLTRKHGNFLFSAR